jgi:hypothetical protein
MKIFTLVQEGKMGTVTRADIDKIFAALDERPAKKSTPRDARREIIRKTGAKDRRVLDRLRDHDKKP